MDGNQHKVEANVLLLGAENVGKSALTVRFLTRRFIGEYGDIESIYSHIDKTDGREIALNIWDSLYPQSKCRLLGKMGVKKNVLVSIFYIFKKQTNKLIKIWFVSVNFIFC
uniref:small monomeric GTPase n=1 Tax=Sinocyclocheilus grahami TaxID=75366 RepID=A0A672KAB0_SINGR